MYVRVLHQFYPVARQYVSDTSCLYFCYRTQPLLLTCLPGQPIIINCETCSMLIPLMLNMPKIVLVLIPYFFKDGQLCSNCNCARQCHLFLSVLACIYNCDVNTTAALHGPHPCTRGELGLLFLIPFVPDYFFRSKYKYIHNCYTFPVRRGEKYI